MWDLLILNPMTNLLLWIYSVLGDFGIAIIIFTVLTRLLTHPLTVQQMKGAQAMQDMQKSPEWLEIQKKYKDDKQKLQMEQARYLQEKGVNPFSSCLPLVIQLPIIFGLYQALTHTLAVAPIQLMDLTKRVYPFINASALIPIKSQFLWMDLSQPERLIIFGAGIPTLAILVVITQFISGRLMTPATSGGSDQAAAMTKSMNLYMPFLMGWIAWSLPSGLAIYFVASNVVTVLQYAAMGKVNWRNLLPGQKAQVEPAPATQKQSSRRKK
jgi:YidC/Oxa1 family membrane protein insertase